MAIAGLVIMGRAGWQSAATWSPESLQFISAMSQLVSALWGALVSLPRSDWPHRHRWLVLSVFGFAGAIGIGAGYKQSIVAGEQSDKKSAWAAAELKASIANQAQEHQKEVGLLRDTILSRDTNAVPLNRERIAIARQQLEAKYDISANLFVESDRFRLVNRGVSDITYWGNKWGGLPTELSSEPALITKGDSLFFAMNEAWTKDRVSKVGQDSSVDERIVIYLKDALQRKWRLEGMVYSETSAGKLSTRITVKPAFRGDWP